MIKIIKHCCRSLAILCGLGLCQSAMAVDAPQPVGNGAVLSWPAVNAITINVHNENGDFLASLPGNSTRWQAPRTGRYFLVGADHGNWQGWGRSALVTATVPSSDSSGLVQSSGSSSVNAQSSTGAIEDYIPMVPENFRISVYSDSALELFWDHASDHLTHEVSYEVTQNDESIAEFHTGSSLFIDGLNPGQSYVFRLEAVAFALNASDAVHSADGFTNYWPSG